MHQHNDLADEVGQSPQQFVDLSRTLLLVIEQLFEESGVVVYFEDLETSQRVECPLDGLLLLRSGQCRKRMLLNLALMTPGCHQFAVVIGLVETDLTTVEIGLSAVEISLSAVGTGEFVFDVL